MHLLHPSSTAQNCDRLLDCVFHSYKASHLVTTVRFVCFFTIFSVYFCQQVKIITACQVKLLLLLLHLLPVFHPNGRAEAYHSASLCRMAVNTNLTWNVHGRFLQVGQEVMARLY